MFNADKVKLAVYKVHYAVKRMLVHTGDFRFPMLRACVFDGVSNCLQPFNNARTTLCVLACQSKRGNSIQRNDENADSCTPSAKK